MRQLRLTARLAWRNLRRHAGGAALLAIALITATTTLTMALCVGAGAQAPWDRAFAETDGAQILANSEHLSILTALTHAHGVEAAIGPYPVYHETAYMHGSTLRLTLVGRDTLNTPIDRPQVTAGTADLSGNAIVLEQSVANTIHAHVGDTVQVNGITLTLRGIALSTAQPPFPRYGPGLAWISTTTTHLLAASEGPAAYQVELRLDPATDAGSFVAAQHIDPRTAFLTTWLEIRQQAMTDVRTLRIVLLTVSTLLALLTSCAVAVLVAARMNTRIRQIGTFKASGVTPGQAVAVILLEYLYVAICATVLGLFAGVRAAALVAEPAGPLLGPAPQLTWSIAVGVAAVTLAVVALAATRPAWQAIRTTTWTSLASPVRAPRPAPRLARVTRILRLPPAAALGTRSVMRRPAQTLMTAGSIVIAVATATAALAVQATFIAQAQPGSAAADNALVALANQAANNRLRALVYLFAVMFVILGAINLLFVAAFTARDTRHNHAVLRAIGFTPSQSVRSLVTTQLVTAAPATLAGIPIGLLLFHAVYTASANGQSDTGPANPPAIWFAGLVLIVTATIGLLSAAPAATLARHSIAPALTTD